MTSLRAIVLSVLFLLPGAGLAQTAPATSSICARITDSEPFALAASDRLSGLAVACIDSTQSLVFADGSLAVDTPVPVGSITKSFTAALALILAAEGRIDLVVGQWCKTAVGRRGIKRQDVNTADHLRQIAAQDVMQLE